MMILSELLSGLGLLICLVKIMSAHPSLVVICIGVGVSSLFTALMKPAFKGPIRIYYQRKILPRRAESGVLSDCVFEPFMSGNSLLAIKIGEVIGAGPGRGIALLILMAGMALAIVRIVVSGLKIVKTLEEGI